MIRHSNLLKELDSINTILGSLKFDSDTKHSLELRKTILIATLAITEALGDIAQVIVDK